MPRLHRVEHVVAQLQVASEDVGADIADRARAHRVGPQRLSVAHVDVGELGARFEARSRRASIQGHGADGDAGRDGVRVGSGEAEVAREPEFDAQGRLQRDTRGQGRAVRDRMADRLPSPTDALSLREVLGVQSAHQVGLVSQALDGLTDQADAALGPGRWDDETVHRRPLDAVKRRRLVHAVREPEGHEHHARAQGERAVEHVPLDVGLLELHLAAFAVLDEGVLHLELRVEAKSVTELVAEEEDHAVQVDVGGGVASVGHEGVEVQFPVAAHGGRARCARPCRCVRRLGRRGRLGGARLSCARLGWQVEGRAVVLGQHRRSRDQAAEQQRDSRQREDSGGRTKQHDSPYCK